MARPGTQRQGTGRLVRVKGVTPSPGPDGTGSAGERARKGTKPPTVFPVTVPGTGRHPRTTRTYTKVWPSAKPPEHLL